MSQDHKKRPRAVRFLFENSIFLIVGALGALVWANLDKPSYDKLVTFDVRSIFATPAEQTHPEEGYAEGSTSATPDGSTEAEPHANAHPHADHDGEHTEDVAAEHGHGEGHSGGHGHGFTLAFIVNDILMALFFAIAAKEVWGGSPARRGSLRSKESSHSLVGHLGWGSLDPPGSTRPVS